MANVHSLVYDSVHWIYDSDKKSKYHGRVAPFKGKFNRCCLLNVSQSLNLGLNLGALLSVEPQCHFNNSHCTTTVQLISRNMKKML